MKAELKLSALKCLSPARENLEVREILGTDYLPSSYSEHFVLYCMLIKYLDAPKLTSYACYVFLSSIPSHLP